MAEAHFQLTLGQSRLPGTARAKGKADNSDTGDLYSVVTANSGADAEET